MRTHACTVWTRARARLHTHTYTRKHTRTHTHSHVRTRTHTHTQSIRNRPFAVVQHHHHFVDNTVPLVQLENKSVGIGGEVLEYGGIYEVQEEAGNVEGVVLTDPSAVVFLQVQPLEKECNAEINVCK